MVVASLEVSTTSAKCILYSGEGESSGVLAEASRRYCPDVADGPTQDPVGMVDCALDVLRQMVQAAEARGHRIEAIGLTGTWHSMLPLDGERKPLGRIMTWADLSGAEHAAAQRRDEGMVRRFYHTTGCMVHAMYPAWKWHYVRSSRPELAERARFIASQTEFLFESLTGQAAVSRSLASGTGLFNIHTLDWDEWVLQLVGLRREQLAPLVEGTHWAPLLPEMAEQVGLPAGLPVTVGCADGAMNQLAIGGLAGGAMSMSVGTSGALRVTHTEPRIPDTPSTWCYYLLHGRRLAGAAVNNATNCVDWFLSTTGAAELTPEVYDRYSEAVAGVDGRRAPIFMPFLFGERCPGWNENRSGGFVGLRSTHGTYDMYYAVLEGILFNMRQCYDILVQVGDWPERVLVSGGITNSEPWMQLAADVMGRELLVTGTANESTVGGALVALLVAQGDSACEGINQQVDCIQRRSAAVKRYVPRTGADAVIGPRYQRYLELYAMHQ